MRLLFALALFFTPLSARAQLSVALEWQTSILGSGIGSSGISVVDLDGDGTREIIAGGASSGAFFPDDFWFVMRETVPDQFEQVWVSELGTAPIRAIAAADVGGDGIVEVFVGFEDGKIRVFDGLTLEAIYEASAAASLSALAIGDVDGDGTFEAVVADGTELIVLSASDLTEDWSTALAAREVAVGNVDSDAAPEIVLTGGGPGYVVDGVTQMVEWMRPEGFGVNVEIGDVDGDGSGDLVAADAWYQLWVFDVSNQMIGLPIATQQDIGALAVTDIGGDGRAEILFGDGQWGSIHVLDGISGVEMWSVANPEHGTTDVAVGDVNGDGEAELVWGAGATSTGRDQLFVADSSGIFWQSVHLDGPLAVAAADLDGSGAEEITVISHQSEAAYADGILRIYDAATRALKFEQLDLPDITTLSGVRAVHLLDIDGDEREILLSTDSFYDAVVQIYDGTTHQVKRQTPVYPGLTFTALAAGDLDANGSIELLVGANGVVLAFNGATAMEENRGELGFNEVQDLEIASVDADPELEVVASLGTDVYVLSASLQVERSRPIAAYAIKVADMDLDGAIEILIGSEGTVEILEGSTLVTRTSIPVGTGPVRAIALQDLGLGRPSLIAASDEGGLAIYDGSNLLFRREGLGAPLALFGQMTVSDVDGDGNVEILLGSKYAVFQFEVTTAPVCQPRTEVCDGTDNDCDEIIDEDGVCSTCVDGDGDGYGLGCDAPDCDDSAYDVNEGRTEGPLNTINCSDGLDNDCDGNADQADSNCRMCAVNAHCDDGDACTFDVCSGGICTTSPMPTCAGDLITDEGGCGCRTAPGSASPTWLLLGLALLVRQLSMKRLRD